MSDAPIVKVSKDIQDLVPAFMANRHKEVDALRAALEANDLETLRRLAHRMRGVGASYGFPHVSVIGKAIEDGVRRQDRVGLAAQINVYRDYLARVEIAYE
jgi:HPt (histidine-containing phosphotransfer) domain-containing protein